MKLPRMRLSMRMLMILIAMLAVSLAALTTLNRSIGRGAQLWKRAQVLAAIGTMAREHAANFRSYPHSKSDWCNCCGLYYGEGPDEATFTKKRNAVHSQVVRQFDSIAARADSMSRQCLYAADRPWVATPVLPGEASLKAEAFDLFERFRNNADAF